MQQEQTIVLTGGGTAGHVSANLALLPYLLKMGLSVHYIGTQDGIEHQLVSGLEGVQYHVIQAGKLRRYADLKNLRDPFRVLKGIAQSRALLKRIKPALVFSKGGFVAVPVMVAARLTGTPALAHESDLTPGLANRISIKFASSVLTSFPQTVEYLRGKGVYTGSPIREELFRGDAARGRKLCGFGPQKPVCLVIGGSSGAVAVNQAVRQALPGLSKRFSVAHLCGQGNLDASLQGTQDYFQMEYAKAELPDLFAAADVMISRAGANSLFELLALAKPALLIPLPLSASRGDQIDNAKSFAQQGFSHVLMQEDMTPELLVQRLDALYASRAECIQEMRKNAPGDGCQRVLDEIKKCLAKAGRSA